MCTHMCFYVMCTHMCFYVMCTHMCFYVIFSDGYCCYSWHECDVPHPLSGPTPCPSPEGGCGTVT